MANDDTNAGQQPSGPNPALRSLGDRLVGTWEMSGDVRGTVAFEWMDCGVFALADDHRCRTTRC